MYENQTKAEARQWAWNRICEKFPHKNHKKNTSIACLIGDTTNELETGIQKGFQKKRIIGVDVREESIAKWRAAGGIAFHGTISDAAQKIKPDAYILDYCSGMTDDNVDTTWLCFIRSKIITVNMLRGRDHVNKYRDPRMKACTNRGELLTSAMMHYLLMTAPKHVTPELLYQSLNPKYYSYKSKDSGQTFDMVKLENRFVMPHE